MTPLLSRTFEAGGEQVVCTFGAPVPDRDDFRCDFEITSPTRTRRSYAFGVDSVQALLLAMQKAHVDLLSDPERVLWLGSEDLGLPLPSNVTPADFDR